MENFFLFASILDANMIDRKLADKAIAFEVSLGEWRTLNIVQLFIAERQSGKLWKPVFIVFGKFGLIPPGIEP